MNRQKLTIFLLLAGAAVLVFILAASLGQVKLLPGQPLTIPRQSVLEDYVGGSPTLSNVGGLILRGIFAITLILTPFALIYALLSKQGRKQLFMLLANVLIILLAITMLQKQVREEAPISSVEPGESLSPVGGEEAAGSAFVAEPPEWTIWAASLVIALLLAGISMGLLRLVLHRRELPTTLERLAEEAQDAIDQLELGEDLRETILRCYREMTAVVKESRGIERERYMTPREFEILLQGKGLPAESLLRLTRLFEEVRYGGQLASHQEEQLAILCLRDIVAACREVKFYEA